MHFGDDWRAVGFFQLRVTVHLTGAPSLPSEPAGALVERGDELPVAAVHVKDQQVVPEDRRAAGTVFVHHPQVLVGPKHLAALGVETGRSVRAVLAVQLAGLEDRRRRGVAVRLVHPLRGFLFQQFDIFDDLAAGFINAQRVDAHLGENRQRLAAGVGFQALLFLLLGRDGFVCCRHPDLVAENDRRRPAAPWQLGAPGDVLPLAPLGGELGGLGVALATRPAPLGPIGQGRGHRSQRSGDNGECNF